jgi:hypothetical protein
MQNYLIKRLPDNEDQFQVQNPREQEDLQQEDQQEYQNYENNSFEEPKQVNQVSSRRNSVGSSVLTPDSFTYDPTAARPYICNPCGKDFESKVQQIEI